VRQLNDAINTTLAGISARTLDYTNPLAGLLTALATLNTSVLATNDPATAVITKAPLDTANLEVKIDLPANTKLLMFRCRRDGTGVAQDLRYAFRTGQVGNIAAGNYRVLDAYNEYRERLGSFNGSLYLACAAASTNNLITVEIEAWS